VAAARLSGVERDVGLADGVPPLGRRVVLALRFSLDGFLHAVPPHPVRIPAQPCACESTPIARGAGEILVGRARYPVDDRKSLDSFSLHPLAPALLRRPFPHRPARRDARSAKFKSPQTRMAKCLNSRDSPKPLWPVERKFGARARAAPQSAK